MVRCTWQTVSTYATGACLELCLHPDSKSRPCSSDLSTCLHRKLCFTAYDVLATSEVTVQAGEEAYNAIQKQKEVK